MKIAGVIAEYNPFHNGHKYHLEETRRLGATHIVAVMSGSAVQRGDIAVADKLERARTAVDNGADLVIELPCPYSCSSAERFANAGIQLLAGLGENTVSMLSFGSESCKENELDRILTLVESKEVIDKVSYFTSSGFSYPAALSQTLGSELLRNPNDVLGLEYIRAIKKLAPWIKPRAIMRQGVLHDSDLINEKYASASYIREMLKTGRDNSELMPGVPPEKCYFIDNADKILMYHIMTATYEELMELPDMNERLARRALTVRDGCCSAEEFEMKLKNKSVTLARIRRMILHLALGVKRTDMFSVPYGRILALNNRGREILSAAKNRTLVYDTSLTKLEAVSKEARRISLLEQRAAALQQLSAQDVTGLQNEYTRKITIQD